MTENNNQFECITDARKGIEQTFKSAQEFRLFCIKRLEDLREPLERHHGIIENIDFQLYQNSMSIHCLHGTDALKFIKELSDIFGQFEKRETTFIAEGGVMFPKSSLTLIFFHYDNHKHKVSVTVGLPLGHEPALMTMKREK